MASTCMHRLEGLEGVGRVRLFFVYQPGACCVCWFGDLSCRAGSLHALADLLYQ
jgi:hypothetical protein